MDKEEYNSGALRTKLTKFLDRYGRKINLSLVDEVSNVTVKVLKEALGASKDEITPYATVKGDLEFESIDELDIIFRLEKELGIRIEQGELFVDGPFDESHYNSSTGRYTERGMILMRNRYGHWMDTMKSEDIRRFEIERTKELFYSGQNVLGLAFRAYELCQEQANERAGRLSLKSSTTLS